MARFAREKTSSIAAVRGAISVARNDAALIREATARLLLALLEANALDPSRIVSAIFTATPDLNADFPAHAARKLGWHDVPLLGATEMRVAGAPKRIVRVLLTVNGLPRGARLTPVYLDEAARLRPDLTPGPGAAARSRQPMNRIAIIGLGQIGGSIGLALARRGGWHRVGFDRDARVMRQALAAGAIDEAAGSLRDACARADLAVLATPVDTLPGAIDAAARALPKGAALLDTGSARGPITPALEQAAKRGVAAVGGHPLAGREGRGIAAASADLFDGAPFALLPLRRAVPAIVEQLVRDVGARALRVTPARHDAALARTSHLPYVLACALLELGGAAARARLAGPGFASMTRLARSDRKMAEAYVRANAREVQQSWDELRAALDRRVASLSRASAPSPARARSPRAAGSAARPSRSRRGNGATAVTRSKRARGTSTPARGAGSSRRRGA